MADQKIVFKVGTSSLTDSDGNLVPAKIEKITRQLATLHRKGYQLILVTSGSIAAGFRRLGFDKRPTRIAEKQASAAVGQGLLIEEYTKYLLQDGIVSAQVLLTQDDFADARRYQNASQAMQVLLKQGAIPIINENDMIAVEEIKVGDNDTLSAQVASLLKADLLVLLTDVDGLYTANPTTDPDAQHIPEVKQISDDLQAMARGAGSANGTGGMMTKIQAAVLATRSGVPVYICSSASETALIDAVTQSNKGTLFHADTHKLNQRKQWLAFYARTDAAVYLDEGASLAMTEHGRSLLVSGVKAMEGEFNEGDIVSVFSQKDQSLIGKGRVKLSSTDLKNKMTQLNPEGIFIHRNDWVSL
ncbi:glutamate 5-kinase [Streptococcus moroccensis]|uniref:Glutamate 5-kinase n=1 Tax=Streptococcus moroccensis TaxID=1451356 RepID=A0ABT9YUD2_9STRE|nr:glutamate 5-kinase [Streptococcus moroccensis]MDQ0222710.1 glutamate 5-kinase [Streptococcus moroccensis]